MLQELELHAVQRWSEPVVLLARQGTIAGFYRDAVEE
jgi:hypothetical protein